MIKKTFRSMVILILCMLAICVSLIMGVLYNYFDKQYVTELKNEAVFIGKGVELNGLDYLNDLPMKNCRITWIGTDGAVLYDNKADAAAMENHGDREEVENALEKGDGFSTRYSKTLDEKTINYAIRLDDQTILRVSSDYDTMLHIVLGMIQPILAIVAIALIVAAIFAYRLSKRIVKPFNEIDLEHPEKAEAYEELAPFLRKIEHQNRQIKKQMQELTRQQVEFAAITENMTEGFLVVDTKQKLLSYNTSALALLDVQGEVEHENVLHLNRSENFQKAITLALEGKHNEQSMKFGEHYYQLFANPVFQDEVLSGAIVVIMDVTEKEQRDALRREFTTNVSHELKTPLTSISGTAEIMGNGLVKQEDVPHFANIIYKEAQRLIALVGDIIKLSKLEEPDMTEQKEMVNMAEVVESVVETLEVPAAKKNISFLVKTEDCVILGIPSILNEIVYNLCDNAVKYNVEKGKVTVSLKKKEKRTVLTVEDTGIGIPREEQERIFERFYRVDKSHSKDIGGTGLGLSIVKHGAAYHNAEITLESEVGKGTKISIIF